MFSPSIFRANDIRGIWNADFDISFTKDLAYGLAYLSKNQARVKKAQFLIGHDARKSSPEIAKTLVKELKKQGIDTHFIGLAPSPLCYFLMQYYQLTGCVVVTASHNPPQFNGFKILFHKKHQIQQAPADLKKILKPKNRDPVYKKTGKKLYLQKEKAYLDSLKKEFSLKKQRLLADTGNGALGPLAHKAFKALGLQAQILFKEPDGQFPNHHPDPCIPDNLRAIKKTLKRQSYPLALAFDGDGDRLVVLDSTGKALMGDELAFLLLKSLKSPKKALVLADVKCSDWFFKKATEMGFRTKMIPSGHALVRAEMEKTKADLALEFSGHIFFNDKRGRGFDDALYAGLRLISYLQSQNKSLKELLPPQPFVSTGEIRLAKKPEEIKKALFKIKKYLKAKKESFKSLDGIRLSRKDSWCLFRASQTQSVFSMRFSSPNRKKLKALKTEFSKVIGFKIP